MIREEVLVGTVVNAITKPSMNSLILHSTIGNIVFTVDGDCCSRATIEDWLLEGPAELTGDYDEVTEIVEATVQDVDRLYTLTLATKTGKLVIRHRNSSNGYYGNYWYVRKNREE